MNNNVLILIILTVLVLFSAFFSATETAFSSLNKIKLKSMAAKGNKRAERVLAFAENFDKILSTILIGNNIVNMASASIATMFFTRLFGDAGVSLSTIVMTVAVLIFGEITPKVIAKDMPERFAMLVMPLLKIFYTLLYPFSMLFSLWKKLITRLFHAKRSRGVTEEELLIMVEEAQQDGDLDQQAGDLIRSAIEFDDLDAVEICTPRIDIIAVRDQAEIPEISALFKTHGYSRLPVYQGSIDNIIGFISQKDFYAQVIEEKQPLSAILLPMAVIRPNTKISKLLRILQKKRSHIALIVDEYGGTLGIVTLEDIIEELVGEIWDEHDVVIQEFEQISETEYKVSGRYGFQKLLDRLHVRGEDEEFDFVSVNGWVLSCSEHMPKVGDCYSYQNLQIRVSNATERAVTEVLVTVEEISDNLSTTLHS